VFPFVYLVCWIFHYFMDILVFFTALMGTELARACVKEENMEIPSIPPGFESLAPFTLKKVEPEEMKMNYSTPVAGSVSQTTQMVESECGENTKIVKSLRRRPWINYCQLDNSSGDESDSEQVFLQLFFKTCIWFLVLYKANFLIFIVFEIHISCLHVQNLPLRPQLSKGVVRGCDECVNCQKVSLAF
jgi:hypothetical protein